jgi:hypothetical protein
VHVATALAVRRCRAVTLLVVTTDKSPLPGASCGRLGLAERHYYERPIVRSSAVFVARHRAVPGHRRPDLSLQSAGSRRRR